MIFKIYKYFLYFLIPFIRINLQLRIIRNKEEEERIKERFGISKIIRPKKNLIWIHAASVGEFNSATGLIKKLKKSHKILLTTSTVTAYQYSKKIFGNDIIHQYAPIDHVKWVKRFLNYWHPNLVIWIESDLWPNTIKLISEKKIKMILLNLRISPKSLKRWGFFRNNFCDLMHCFDKVFVQSEYELKNIKKLTSKKIRCIGNLKLTSIKSTFSYKKLKKLKHNISAKKIILIASSHQNEEVQILKILRKIYNKNNKFMTIIIPRHPNRSSYVLKIANRFFSNASISYGNKFKKSTNCLIINSLGEMSTYYQLSDIVILGGSFVNMGGHNPLEPAQNKCNILTGPSIYNWHNIYEEMVKEEALIICKTFSILYENINKFLINKKIEDKYKKNALKYSKKKNNIIKDLISEIKPYLDIVSNA